MQYVSDGYGYGGSNKYFINGVQQPTLTLQRGNTYVFTVNNSSHPVSLYTTSDKSVEYTSGVVDDGSGFTFTVPQDSPNILYYQCDLHSNMGGQINII